MRALYIPIFTTLLLGAIAQAQIAYFPCRHVKSGDKGYAVLIGTVFTNNSNTLATQKLLGMPQTPVTGQAKDIDAVKFCNCIFQMRSEKFGREIAIAMNSLNPKEAKKYSNFVDALSAEDIRKHPVVLWSIDATCVNKSY